jgi:hypothetical protein
MGVLSAGSAGPFEHLVVVFRRAPERRKGKNLAIEFRCEEHCDHLQRLTCWLILLVSF